MGKASVQWIFHRTQALPLNLRVKIFLLWNFSTLSLCPILLQSSVWHWTIQCLVQSVILLSSNFTWSTDDPHKYLALQMIEKNCYFFLFFFFLIFFLNRIASSLTSAFGIGIMDKLIKRVFFFFVVCWFWKKL